MNPSFSWNRIASQKELIIWISLLSLVLWVGARKIYSPMTEKLNAAHAQIDAKQMEVDIHQKLKKNKVGFPSSPSESDSGRLALSQKVNQSFSRNNMAPDVVASELLTSLTSPKFSKAVLVEKFNFTGEKKQIGFSEMNLDLKLVGTYEGIANYLQAVRKLPYLLKVDSVSLKPYDAVDPLKVELSGKVILYVGDKNLMVQFNSFSRSDTAIDLLPGMNLKKTYSPFVAKSREESAWSLRELKLTSTMAGGPHPTALINGQMFELGGEIAEFKIAEVRSQQVVLQRGDVRYILKLSEKLSGDSEGSNEIGNGRGKSSNSKTNSAEAMLVEETSPGAESGQPDPEENIDSYRKNEYGIMTEEKDIPPSQQTPSEEASPENEPGTPPDLEVLTSKLNPNDVEDIEGVPFDDLEDPPQVSVLE